MSDDFDLAHDKLPDLPPIIIGGDKSAAAWHGTPEVPHADLIAQLRERASSFVVETDEEGLARQRTTFRQAMREAADALAALGDTVPREEAERAARDAMAREARLLDERDALAHVIEQAKAVTSEMADTDEYPLEFYWRARILRHLATAPAASLARIDEATS